MVISLTNIRDGTLSPVEGPANDSLHEFNNGICPSNSLQTATLRSDEGSITPHTLPKGQKK
jgi:hypothetical protein